MEYKCNICDKLYSSYQSLWIHNKKFHNKKNTKCTSNVNTCTSTVVQNTSIDEKNKCKYCLKKYSSRQNKWNHEQKCKTKKKEANEINELKETINEMKKQFALILKDIDDTNKLKEENINLKKELKNINLTKVKEDIDDTNKLKEENINLKKELKNINLTKIKEDIDDLKNNPPINNQLINIISDKNKKIEELNKFQPIVQPVIEKQIKTFETLTLNSIVITSRIEDNYINATQLCQAGGKKFNHWYSLDNTKQLINELASDTGIPVSLLIDIKKGNSNEFNQGTWIHPDLAIQLAQWLSPKFAIQVSKWIMNLFTDGKVEINTKLLTENKLKDQKIKLLEDTYVKKHKREDYSDRNVIYILSTVDHLKNRIYIVGKAKNLKNRLSVYNKTCDHQVIYYKKCINEEILNLVELNILNKLKQYQEKANRDRFILPVENDISLFTDIIENCINFFK